MTSQLLGLRAEQFKRLQLVELDFNGATGTYAVIMPNGGHMEPGFFRGWVAGTKAAVARNAARAAGATETELFSSAIK